MFINVLKCKIHRATVTDAQIHYHGSITIDRELMDRAGLLPFEKVMVVSLDSGERLETYVIEGVRGSGEICLNGAAARKILKGDTVIIIAFVTIEAREYATFEPVIVHVDANNRIVEEENGEPDDQC